MKHAKPFLSRHPETWPGLIAIAAIVAIVTMLGLNAKANENATKPTQQVYGTTGQCAVNVNGDCTVNHGLGTKPTSVVVTPANGGQQATVDPAKTTDTNFTVRFLWRDGTRFKIGTVIKYNVVYTYVGTTVPTTTPSTSSTPTQSPTTTTPADACVNPTWTSSEKLGSHNFDNTTRVNNNKWNDAAGPQTISACYWNSWYVVSDQPGDGDNDSVKTYPDTQKDVNISMANVPNINTSWKVATPSAGGVGSGAGKQWNAAYDLWLNDFDSEVMVWTNWNANWQYWYNTYGGQEVTLDGVAYYVYHKPASGGNASGIWFVRKNNANQGSMNLKPLLDFAKSKDWIKTTDTLEHIEYGFEIMYTGEPTRFDLLDYTLSVGSVQTPTPTPTVTPTNTTPPEQTCNPQPKTSAEMYAYSTSNAGPYQTMSDNYFLFNDMWNNHTGGNNGPTGTYEMVGCSYDKWYELITQADSPTGAVRAYPKVGRDYEDGKMTPLTDVVSSKFASTNNCDNCAYDVAYDIWINYDLTNELMIWTDYKDQTPAGDKIITVTIGGKQYDLWYTESPTSKGEGGIFTYVSKTKQTAGTMPLGEFFKDLETRGWIKPTGTAEVNGVKQINFGIEMVSTRGVQKRFDVTDFDIVEK